VIVLLSYLGLIIIEKVTFRHPHLEHSDEEPLQSRGDNRLLPPTPHKKGNLATPIMLLIALCIHSIFEGLVFGLQDTEAQTVTVMIAILSHKPIETLFLGIVMVKEYVQLSTHIVIITILSIITPLGICIGLALNDLEISPTANASFGAIAAGTFLYISTTEIISEEFNSCMNNAQRWKKFIALALGLAFIFVLRIWVEEHDEHHDDHDDHDHI